MGRPSKYTPERAEAICTRLVEGESLRTICQDSTMPAARTVFRWLEKRDDFRQQYARAREAQAEGFADEIVDIADRVPQHGPSEAIQRAKLRVDARKWVSSRLLPKKYGAKQRLEHTGKDGGPIEHEASVHFYIPDNGRDDGDDD